MKIIVARTAGFCMGVRRAVDMVLGAAESASAGLVTIGPLIHNRQVVEMLERKGVRVVDDVRVIEDVGDAAPGGMVAVRAHGIAPRTRRLIEEAGLACLDTTCPLVVRIQKILSRYADNGYTAVIVGDKGHAEVVGLLAHAAGRGVVVESEADLDAVPPGQPLCVVAQSTQSREFFEAVVAKLRARDGTLRAFDTVCDATAERQNEVRRLAGRCDAIVVVGGAHSANTQRLAGIARALGIETYLVEKADDLVPADIARHRTVGVTAGASTPNWLIEHVIARLRDIGGAHKPWAQRALSSLLDFFVQGDLYIGVGAGLLCFACIVLQNPIRAAAPPMPLPITIAACYVFAVHILNHFTDPEYSLYKESYKLGFLEQHKRVLVPLGALAAASAVALSAALGWVPFAIVCFATLMGLIYNLPILPFPRLRRIRNIPASKNIGMAGAWCVITVIPPLFEQPVSFNYALLLNVGVVFLFAFTMVFVRSMILDMRDIQGDLMVGDETIPIILGRRLTKALLYLLLAICAAGLIVGALAGWTSRLGLWLLIAPAYSFLCIVLYNRGVLVAGLITEVVIDAGFYLAGLVALLYWFAA
jgi:4-hydroxy-3-methylbut-2-enyl diphosphate reductase